MTERTTAHRSLAKAAAVVLLCSAIASVRACSFTRGHPATAASACSAVLRDSATLASEARDTIARLRARSQRVTRFRPMPDGAEVRTESRDSLSIHAGGLVGFDCAGGVTMVWLDGG